MPGNVPAGARLVDMVVPPHALVEAAGKLRLHATYYITKQIVPALERVLNLVGADPRGWFAAMSRPQRLLPQKRPPAALPLVDPGRPGANAGTIDQYYLSRHCAVCACKRQRQLVDVESICVNTYEDFALPWRDEVNNEPFPNM